MKLFGSSHLLTLLMTQSERTLHLQYSARIKLNHFNHLQFLFMFQVLTPNCKFSVALNSHPTQTGLGVPMMSF